MGLSCCCEKKIEALRLRPRAGDDGVDVKDQRDASIAEDGRRGDARNVLVIRLNDLRSYYTSSSFS
jgi:hypothetical protein